MHVWHGETRTRLRVADTAAILIAIKISEQASGCDCGQAVEARQRATYSHRQGRAGGWILVDHDLQWRGPHGGERRRGLLGKQCDGQAQPGVLCAPTGPSFVQSGRAQ
jgi:hypothetical protein